jgi:hypothetical protein
MRKRDIKNLVGRAGRAGSSTRGLVICANPNQWQYVYPVAAGNPGEIVTGGLYQLIGDLGRALIVSKSSVTIDNSFLDGVPELFPLVDGVDATLVELLSDDIGKDEFLRLAENLVSETFAVKRTNNDQERILRRVFSLRASWIHDLRANGRLSWVCKAGAMPRMVSPVLDDLFPTLPDLEKVESVLDPVFLDSILRWALSRQDFVRDAKDAYRIDDAPSLAQLRSLNVPWLQGETYKNIAHTACLAVDECLRIHTKVVSYSLVTLVEQAIALLQVQAAESGKSVSEGVALFPDYLRYGVPSRIARNLMANGMRHRQAAIILAQGVEKVVASDPVGGIPGTDSEIAKSIMQANPDMWREALGPLVYGRTEHDLRRIQ